VLYYDRTYKEIGRAARIMRGFAEVSGARANHHKYIEDPAFWYRQAWEFVKKNEIRPRSRVFDIGPGTGYFLYILKTEFGCDVSGTDRPFPFFSVCRELLGLNVVIERVHRYRPIQSLQGRYDYITAFGACFDCSLLKRIWDKGAYDFWFNDMIHHLKPGGQLITQWNAPTLWPMVQHLPFQLREWNYFVYTQEDYSLSIC
jgi:SAM-dependent methyltransferase